MTELQDQIYTIQTSIGLQIEAVVWYKRVSVTLQLWVRFPLGEMERERNYRLLIFSFVRSGNKPKRGFDFLCHSTRNALKFDGVENGEWSVLTLG